MQTRKPRSQHDTQDFEGPQGHEIDMHSSVATEDIDRPDLITVTDDTLQSPHVQEYIKDMKFMEDQITFVVQETTDPNAETVVSCGVNGERKDFVRGKEYKAARKFVDSLIKKNTSVKTQQYKDGDGLDQTKMVTTAALVYPISIISDPAGETGRRWFKHACENAW